MKFFVFIAIVVSLWYVMRWIQQAEAARRLHTRDRARPARGQQNTMTRTTDMKACSRDAS